MSSQNEGESSSTPPENVELNNTVDSNTVADHFGSNGSDVGCSSGPLNGWVSNEDVLKAEAYWALYSAVNHLSCRASNNTSVLFEVMFSDSYIAKQFRCGKDKVSYMINFGLYPYFSDQLSKSLSECPLYSVSFDDSFNRITKNEQLDLAVRYWDNKLSCPVTRYLGSEFLGHSTADNLLSSFNKATLDIDPKKIINIGMDGPATNHKFFRLIQAERNLKCEHYCI